MIFKNDDCKNERFSKKKTHNKDNVNRVEDNVSFTWRKAILAKRSNEEASSSNLQHILYTVYMLYSRTIYASTMRKNSSSKGGVFCIQL